MEENKLPFNVKLFSFLITPAQLWIYLCGWVCDVNIDMELEKED